MSIHIFHGDCLQVMKDLSGGSVDCFICDLPYGCLGGGFDRPGHNEEVKKKVARQTESSVAWDVKIDLDEFWTQVKRLARNEHTPVLMFCTTKFGYELIKSNEKWFRYDLVWDKQRGVSFLSANKMPMRSHEMIYVFSKSGAYYNRVDVKGDFKKWNVKRENQTAHCYGEAKKNNTEGGDGTRCVKSIVSVDGHESRHKNQHPTEKPLSLYKWLLERYCRPGGTVLDPTAGSFNSCFAAYELDRHAIGIEKDDGFFAKGLKRLEDLEAEKK